MTKESEIPLRVTSDRNLAEEWELALLAQGLSPSLSRTQDGFVLSVPEEQVGKALIGLSTYEGENPPKLREGDAPAEPPNFIAGASIAGILMLFFFITVALYPTVPGFEHGSADTDRILLGELWLSPCMPTLRMS